MGQKLQSPGTEQAIEKGENQDYHEKTIGDRQQPIRRQQETATLRPGRLAGTAARQRRAEAGDNRPASLPQVGNLEPVGKDVVAVIAEQRISVQQDGTDGTDEQNVEAKGIQGTRRRRPPGNRRQRGEGQLDMDPSR